MSSEMKKAPPPPTSQAPVSKEVVEIVKKKKLGQPLGPPPAGMAGFKAPKLYSPQKNSAPSHDESSMNYSSDDEDAKHMLTQSRTLSGRDRDQSLQSESKTKASPKRFPAKGSDDNIDSNSSRPTTGAPVVAPSKNEAANKTIFNFRSVLQSTYRELRSFVLSPLAPGYIARCYIERSHPAMKLFAPHYSLCADMEDGTGRELIVCRKVLKSSTPYYIFSLKQEDLYRKREQRSRLYLGKLRGVTSYQYVLYDSGIRLSSDGSTPTMEEAAEEQDEEEREAAEYIRSQVDNGKESESLYRKELAVIRYNSRKRPSVKGTRGLEVGIPKVSSANPPPTTGASSSPPGSILIPFNRAVDTGKQNVLHGRSVHILHERNSRYDPLSSCLVDFKGRANVPSVKNCQLIESEPMDEDNPTEQEKREYLVQLGKTTEDCFNLDFKHPLSLLQAFAVAISRFDAKLGWSS